MARTPPPHHHPWKCYSDIIGAAQRILSDVRDCGGEERLFPGDPFSALPPAISRARRAIERDFMIIGEAASRIRGTLELDAPDYPWGEVTGLANALDHEYDAVKEDLLREAIADLPRLIEITTVQRTRYDPSRPTYRAEAPRGSTGDSKN